MSLVRSAHLERCICCGRCGLWHEHFSDQLTVAQHVCSCLVRKLDQLKSSIHITLALYWLPEINTLNRLISPPSVGEEDMFLGIIQIPQLHAYRDKKRSPISEKTHILSIAWLSCACKHSLVWYWAKFHWNVFIINLLMTHYIDTIWPK